jgi:Holliday junction resolvasome RuvABC endonuclease subunit
MITLQSKNIINNFPVVPPINSMVILGVDTAPNRTGWCLLNYLSKTNIKIDFGFIDISSENILDKYNLLIDFFEANTQEVDKVIIEESFFAINVKSFQKLSRVGMLVYVCAYFNKIKDIQFVLASQARNKIGLKNGKKEIVHKEFFDRYKIKIDEPNCIDACILALGGLVS